MSDIRSMKQESLARAKLLDAAACPNCGATGIERATDRTTLRNVSAHKAVLRATYTCGACGHVEGRRELATDADIDGFVADMARAHASEA